MEITFSFTVTGPITYHGNREDAMRPFEITRRLGEVRKKHYYPSARGGISKLVLDELMRERLRLEELNRWNRWRSLWRAQRGVS